ncbi:MAG: oxidoreductase [Hyphomicrobiales bacterium]
MNWTPKSMKSQMGKSFLVTGANAGLGFETALELAKKEAYVIMVGRNQEKLSEAKGKILASVPDASIEIGVLDLSNIKSIKLFANEFVRTHASLDVLINNAGIMFPPAGKTSDGFETQFGVNFIGHYVLTALLFPLLKNSENARIVTLSSIAHKGAEIDYENIKLEKPFNKFREYGQSKVADLIFSLELQRKINQHKLDILSVACHPGVSKTELLRYDVPEMIETVDYMSANQGAFPTLYAATEELKLAPSSNNSFYFGPNGKDEINGYPELAFIAPYASDKLVGSQLWQYAETETGVGFDFGS